MPAVGHWSCPLEVYRNRNGFTFSLDLQKNPIIYAMAWKKGIIESTLP